MAPAELEALLLTHPGVDDTGVVGIPDEEAGELPRAYLVKKPGHTVTENDIHTFMSGKKKFLFNLIFMSGKKKL